MNTIRPFHTVERSTLLAISYAWLGYGALFLYLEPIIGSIAAALVLLPVFVSAWYGGMAYAMLSAMVSFSFNMYMYILATVTPPTPLEHLGGNLIALVFAFAIVIVSETRKQLVEEVSRRETIEIELRQLNHQLGNEVEQHSTVLQNTNLKLRQELNSRKNAQYETHYRESILETVSAIAEVALKADGWATIIPDALEQLGRATKVDRVYLFENGIGSRGQVLTNQIEEWHAPGIPDHKDDPQLARFDFQARGFNRWVEILSQGGVINGEVDQLPKPERDFLTKQGVTSILIVPVLAGYKWWGCLGFDSVGQLEFGAKQ